jgi:hypothetical protein
MSLLVFLPMLVCLYFVVRGQAEKAFLAVYLPAIFWLPEAYGFHIPHLPTMSVSEGTVIPLGVLALYRFVMKGRFVLMDLLMALFMVSITLSELLKERVFNDGIFMTFGYIVSVFLPYIVGRVMIEPELRLATTKRIVLLVLFLGVPGLFEWRFGHNLFAPFGRLIGADMPEGIQMRGGRGRFAVSFSDAEIAGIAVAMTAALNAWLAFMTKRLPWQSIGKTFFPLEKYHIAAVLLFGYVYFTQSRGPLMALFVGYLILQIPRFKNRKLASGLVALVILMGTIAAYQYFARYANVTDPNAHTDEQQGSAAYRFRMNRLYAPIAEEGGWLGWSRLSFPPVPSMLSIDNEFLLIRLSQGLLGYILLILIAVESVRSLVVRSWRFKNIEDIAFLFSMLAAMAIFWFSITTVYLGEQLPQVGFLFIGWSQSIVQRQSSSAAAVTEVETPAKFRFRRVLQ